MRSQFNESINSSFNLNASSIFGDHNVQEPSQHDASNFSNMNSSFNPRFNDSFKDLQRRNTVTGFDSPYSTRRRIALFSTPTNRQSTPRQPLTPAFNGNEGELPQNGNQDPQFRSPMLNGRNDLQAAPKMGVSFSTTSNEETNSIRPLESSRHCTPHFFGTTLTEKTSSQLKKDADSFKMNEDGSNALRSLVQPIQSTIGRSNTFATRNRDNRFSPYSKSDKEKLVHGPPLRSLRDLQPAIKPKVDDIPQSSPAPLSEERDYWVTVIGFEAKDADSMIELFGRHGQIVKTARPFNGDGNWIHIRYATKIHADQALQRNGQQLKNNFIGVFQSPQVNYGCESREWEVSTKSTNVPANRTPEDAANRVSAMRRLTGMRPLAAPTQNGTPQSKGSGLIGFLFKGGK